MNDEEKKEIKELYTKYAKQGLIDCKNMTEKEEFEYSKQKEKELKKELEKIRKKYST